MSSIIDVAKLAGTSKSTVSRVIQNNGPVNTETRERVLKAIRDLDYTPNLLASGLKAKSGKLIGLILPDPLYHEFGVFIQAIGQICMQHNLGLIVGTHHDEPELESKLFEDFFSRNIDGLIISAVSDDSILKTRLKSSLGKVVLIDRKIDGAPCSSVSLNNYKAGVLIGNHLCQFGHSRFAIITGPKRILLCREREQGFSDSLSKHGFRINPNLSFECNFTFEAGAEVAKKLLEMRPEMRPTAVWCENDRMALGLIKALSENGIRVPEDIAVAGMDNEYFSSINNPGLTTLSQPSHAMAEEAVKILLKETTSPEKMVFDPILVIRESTAGKGNA